MDKFKNWLTSIWMSGSTTKKIYMLAGSSSAVAGLAMVIGFLNLCFSGKPDAASIGAAGVAVVSLFTALFGFASNAQKHKAKVDNENKIEP